MPLAPTTPEAIARAFEAACLAELRAVKPGNVFVGSEGHGMTVQDFARSAAAAAPALVAPAAGVGVRLLAAVRATRDVVGQNTNLGILLLATPLVEAALGGGAGDSLEVATAAVLRATTIADADAVYAAIRLARPGGLGRSATQDVAAVPSCTLLEAMTLAADRDRIAWNHVHDLADLFGPGRYRLRMLAARSWPPVWIVTGIYLGFLGMIPDTHVARKHGTPMAGEVQRRAASLDAELLAAAEPQELEASLLAFDRELKHSGINPGTSADLTVATLLAETLTSGCNPAIDEAPINRVEASP